MSGARDVLDEAKRLRGALMRLAARRERLVQKANGDFQLELLAAISEADTEILGLVQRALAFDCEEHYLQHAVQLAIDERNERLRRSGDAAECETERPPSTLNAVEAAAMMRSTPPPRFEAFEIEDAPGALADLPAQIESPMDSDDAPAHGRYRYPEPGEPAMQLPDGSIVAIEDASATA